MKNKILLLMVILTLVLSGCGTSITTNQVTTNANQEQVATEVENNQVQADPPIYTLDFGPSEIVRSDYSNNDLLMVTYTFGNNSEETVSAELATVITGFQDGIEVNKVFDSSLTGDNYSKSIRPGAKIECKMLFELTSKSDLEVEAQAFLSMDGSKVTETYKIE